MPSALMNNYGHPDLEFARGEGCWLYTPTDERYLDFAMGIAVNCLGHCHPHLVTALQVQAAQLWHTSNLFRIGPTETLALRLVDLTFADRVFFANSGTEAIECGFKMIRRYQHAQGRPQRKRIIALTESFHGRTLAPVAASRNPLHSEGFLFGDMGFDQVTFGELPALENAITDETAGIILEPIQGEGGIRVASTEYLVAVRELCDRHDLILMFDEVQCGLGRSGTFYFYQQTGIEPDILASAKGLGGGFPIGACLSTEKVAQYMGPGSHGSTFGGNPLATAVGNAVLDVVTSPGFLDHVNDRAQQLRSRLNALVESHPTRLSAVTGAGLMIGLKCAGISNTDLVARLLASRLLVVKSGGNGIRLLPPLNVTDTECNHALGIIEEIIQTWDRT